MSQKEQRRSWTPEKTEIVLGGLAATGPAVQVDPLEVAVNNCRRAPANSADSLDRLQRATQFRVKVARNANEVKAVIRCSGHVVGTVQFR